MQSASTYDGVWVDRFTYKKIVPFDLGDAVFQVVAFGKGDDIGDHYHALTTEVFMVVDGGGCITINGTPHYVSSGDMFLIEPYDAHAISTRNKLVIAIFKPKEYPEDIWWGRAPVAE